MKNLFTVALLAVVVAVSARKGKGHNKKPRHEKANHSVQAEFLDWASKNNKHYKEVAKMRKHLVKFGKSKKDVDDLNEKAKGKSTYELNFFADVLDEDLSQYLGDLDGLDSDDLTGLPDWSS